MKIVGHPIHIILIHFPSALFPMEWMCAVINNYFVNRPSLVDASFYAMSGGVILGWVAVICGAFDLIQVMEKNPRAMKMALLHGGINLSVVIVYSIIAYAHYKSFPMLQPDSIAMLITKAATIAFMIAGNFLGGNLILKYHVAVEHDGIEKI